MISSSENSTAAIGVLKAAASAAARADRNQRLDLLLAEAEPPGDHRGEPGADLDRGPFASQRDPARQRGRAAEELADHGAEGDLAVADERARLGLGNAAAAGVREVAEEQVAGDERAQRRHQHPAPGRASGRIHPRRQPAGEQNEGDDDQADQRADHEAENQGELMFPRAEDHPATGGAYRS